VKPLELDRLYTLSAPSVHPDGWVVVSATRPDFNADAYVGQLWRVPLNGDAAERITRGFRDTSPLLSPNAQVIAFLRAGLNSPPQLAIMAAAGGEPMVITDQRLGVREFCFTEDSSRIVFTAPVPDDGRYGTLDGVDPAAEDPRRITTLTFQENDRGYLHDQRIQLFTVDVPEPDSEPLVKPVGRAAKGLSEQSLVPPATQLTVGDADHTEPLVAGESVIVVAARHQGHDKDLRRDLYRVGLDGSDPVLLTGLPYTTLNCSSPVLVGQDLYFLAQDLGPVGRDFVGVNRAIYRISIHGGSVTRLTDPANLDFESLCPAGPDAGFVYATLAERGTSLAAKVFFDGHLERIPSPPKSTVLALDWRDFQLAATVSTATSPGEVALLGRDRRVLTVYGAGLQEATAIVTGIERTARSRDQSPVHGWVFVPPGEGPHPVLLSIHGGPFAAYGPHFFDETQVYTEAGYAVVMCNPRGSSGYGESHGQAIRGSFGNLDAADVLAFLDDALANVPGLDSTRIGILGGSYGGYLTAWLIAHDQRFRAAVVERGYLDPRSFIGPSDIGWYFAPSYHTDDPAAMDAQSPLLVANQVNTPTLIIHSEQDLRCPLAQALRYYTELKLAGVETELLIFPGENHELSRSGRPWHRKQRFEAILDWFAQHL
jgi:dipeptidyl aminopeptidase/acylaminoacyl peptidase